MKVSLCGKGNTGANILNPELTDLLNIIPLLAIYVTFADDTISHPAKKGKERGTLANEVEKTSIRLVNPAFMLYQC
jgi:hypothetical protein